MATHLDVDYISNLPDDLLLRILSLLHGTKERACTSLLSRRWRYLWTHVSSIEFSASDFKPPFLGDAAAHRYAAAVDACLLSVTAPSLDLLSLDIWLTTTCSPAAARSNAGTVDRWFRYASTRSVRRLKVSVQTPLDARNDDPRIPSSIFCCRALTELRVRSGTFPAVPSNFGGFHSLKKLWLNCHVDDQTLAGLLACCPLLETLDLIGCKNLRNVEILSKQLVNLKSLFLIGHYNGTITASVEAPTLEFIYFYGDLQKLNWKGSAALHEAAIKCIDGTTLHSKDKNLIVAVSNASVLTVNKWFCQFVIPEQYMFKNLKELNCYFDWITGSLLQTFISNLKECPMLEELSIKLSYEARSQVHDSIKQTYCHSQAATDNFLMPINVFLKTVEDIHEDDGRELPERFLELTHPLHHLRKLTVEEFIGSKYEMILVRFLLRSADSLEEVIVEDYLNRDDIRSKEELHLLFDLIPKASFHVQMKLSGG